MQTHTFSSTQFLATKLFSSASLHLKASRGTQTIRSLFTSAVIFKTVNFSSLAVLSFKLMRERQKRERERRMGKVKKGAEGKRNDMVKWYLYITVSQCWKKLSLNQVYLVMTPLKHKQCGDSSTFTGSPLTVSPPLHKKEEGKGRSETRS